MRRLVIVTPPPCQECAARALHPRFGEYYAYVERNRLPDESLVDAQRRITYEHAVKACNGDQGRIATVLVMISGSVSRIVERVRMDAVEAGITARLVS